MNQEYFETLSSLVKKAQEPIQAIVELNVRTLQNLDYVKPDEFSRLKKPEEFLGKQLELVISNSHKALDYMQKLCQITEKAMLSMAKEAETRTKASVEKAKHM